MDTDYEVKQLLPSGVARHDIHQFMSLQDKRERILLCFWLMQCQPFDTAFEVGKSMTQDPINLASWLHLSSQQCISYLPMQNTSPTHLNLPNSTIVDEGHVLLCNFFPSSCYFLFLWPICSPPQFISSPSYIISCNTTH